MENQNMMQKPPKNWLVESILATIFCCIPFGIVGIIHAAKVDKLFYAGDVAGANQAAADAKKWVKITFWLGIISFLIVCIIWGAAIYALITNGMIE